MKETVIDLTQKKVGEVDLLDEIFTSKVNRALIYEMVKMHCAGKREGTASTRNHAFVSGTTAKMYRQKGTGRARHGDARTNIFVGGGKAFGPHPRDYSYKIPKKARKAGLRSVLSLKKNEGKLLIVDNFLFPKIRTKDAIAGLSKIGVKNGLLIIDGTNENFEKSVRNIPGMKCLRWEGLNAYDMLKHEHVVITLPALQKVQEALSL